MNEIAVTFSCEGEQLIGVVHRPVASKAVGVVIPVGGPQYRAGSHRQFILLARRLAESGHAVLRFDARGMGDSTGDFPGFEHLGPDLRAAIVALQEHVPEIRRVVVWGLCDAASAALMNAAELPGLAGVVALNPWARHVGTQASTEVKQYYAKRVFDVAFWRKLMAGQVRMTAAVAEVSKKVWLMLRTRLGPTTPVAADFRERMALGALGFGGAQLYILSGRDHVAAEFVEFSSRHSRLQHLWRRQGVERLDMPEADHTFSSASLRVAIEDATLSWLARL